MEYASFSAKLFQRIEIYEFVDDGVDGETGGGVDVEFAGDMLAVGNDPALFCLTAGIFIGAVWANMSWGRYWGWDPKELGYRIC